MRRRPRIDLGGQTEAAQDLSAKDEARLDRKRKRWAVVNRHRPADENPFLAAIKPNNDNYGAADESDEVLRTRLASLEFGNYPGYFNYRNKSAANQGSAERSVDQSKGCPLDTGVTDERLRHMNEEWFKNKHVLDVGCNRGHITYAVAKKFAPSFVLGVDIDQKMINMANRDLHLHLEEGILERNLDFRIKRASMLSETEAEEALQQASATGEPTTELQTANQDDQTRKHYQEDLTRHFTLSSYISQGPLACPAPNFPKTVCDTQDTESKEPKFGGDACRTSDKSGTQPTDGCDNVPAVFPNNLLFVEHNYVLSRDELVDKQRAFFDTIICLSVTKWIHLNYRDEGLKRFFRRMYNHLKRDGLLLLEAQPFDNYHRKKKLSDRLRVNFNSIQFKPDQFDEYLLSEQVGFRRIVYSTTTEHECAGFKRPMKVFLK